MYMHYPNDSSGALLAEELVETRLPTLMSNCFRILDKARLILCKKSMHIKPICLYNN